MSKKIVTMTYFDEVFSPNSPPVKMLRSVIDSHNAHDTNEDVVLKQALFGDADDKSYSSDIVLVNLTDPLSTRDKTERIVRGRSFQTITGLRKGNPALKIFLVLPPGILISGIDLAACVLAGISGVIEERALIVNEVIGRVISFEPASGEMRRTLLIGSGSDHIHAAQTTVLEWNEDPDVDPRHDLGIWRAAMALAQLEKLEPIIGSGHVGSYRTLADALNLARHLTSFYLNPDDLRRILSFLAHRWLDEGHHPIERFRLPHYARKQGFPRLPVPVTDSGRIEAERRIYEALQDMSLKCEEDIAGMACCEAEI